MVKISRKEGSIETTTNGSFIRAGGVDRRSFDRNPDFVLDWELLIPITTAIVLRRVRSTMLAGRSILPHGAWNIKRTTGQDRRSGYLQNRGAKCGPGDIIFLTNSDVRQYPHDISEVF
jgi:hypothetical protein